MTQILSGTKPDVDLTDGRFYADGRTREHYRWMRANQPVFRDRNGLAAPLPMAVIGDMLGVRPDEREMFLRWSDDLVSSLSSSVSDADMQVTMDAFAAYNEFTSRSIAERRVEPTEDLISVLVHSEVDG